MIRYTPEHFLLSFRRLPVLAPAQIPLAQHGPRVVTQGDLTREIGRKRDFTKAIGAGLDCRVLLAYISHILLLALLGGDPHSGPLASILLHHVQEPRAEKHNMGFCLRWQNPAPFPDDWIRRFRWMAHRSKRHRLQRQRQPSLRRPTTQARRAFWVSRSGPPPAAYRSCRARWLCYPGPDRRWHSGYRQSDRCAAGPRRPCRPPRGWRLHPGPCFADASRSDPPGR